MAPLLKTVPVNSALGFFDPEIEFPLIPVAIAVLPSGKVRCIVLLYHSSGSVMQ